NYPTASTCGSSGRHLGWACPSRRSSAWPCWGGWPGTSGSAGSGRTTWAGWSSRRAGEGRGGGLAVSRRPETVLHIYPAMNPNPRVRRVRHELRRAALGIDLDVPEIRGVSPADADLAARGEMRDPDPEQPAGERPQDEPGDRADDL